LTKTALEPLIGVSVSIGYSAILFLQLKIAPTNNNEFLFKFADADFECSIST